MTLGVINELRQKGIAKKMIDLIKGTLDIYIYLVAEVSTATYAKYVYLDMVSYNNAALLFY